MEPRRSIRSATEIVPQRPKAMRHVHASDAILKIFSRKTKRKAKPVSLQVVPEPEPPKCERVLPFCQDCAKSFETKSELDKHCLFSVVHRTNKAKALIVVAPSSFEEILAKPGRPEDDDMMQFKIQTRKFFWRWGKSGVVLIGQNQHLHCCVHVFDPDQKMLLKHDTLVFRYHDLWQLKATNTRDGTSQDLLYGPYSPDQVFGYLFEFIEVGIINDTNTLVVITPGLSTIPILRTQQDSDLFPFLKLKPELLGQPKASVEFRRLSTDFNAERQALQTACSDVMDILSETDKVLETLQKDSDRLSRLSSFQKLKFRLPKLKSNKK